MVDPRTINVKVTRITHKSGVFRRRRTLHALYCDHCGFLRFVPAFSVGILLMRQHLRGVHGQEMMEPRYSDDPEQVSIPWEALRRA